MPLDMNLNLRKHHHRPHTAPLASARLALGLFAMTMAGGVAAVHARESSATFAVGATVAAIARLELQSAPTGVKIASADLARGYIDVEEPTTLVVRSNSPTGFAIDVSTVAPLFSGIVVHGSDAEATLGAAGGSVEEHWQAAGTMNVVLRFRLFLVPGLAPGRYPWPVRINVRPLTAV